MDQRSGPGPGMPWPTDDAGPCEALPSYEWGPVRHSGEVGADGKVRLAEARRALPERGGAPTTLVEVVKTRPIYFFLKAKYVWSTLSWSLSMVNWTFFL